MFNVCASAASSVENRFCSNLRPSVVEKVLSFSFRYRDGCFLIATLKPTRPFRAELLTVTYNNLPGTVCECSIALISLCMRVSYGANTNRLIVSRVSILMFFSASAT
jgi:hypothetical protein